jgi:hypothetical protein
MAQNKSHGEGMILVRNGDDIDRHLALIADAAAKVPA